MKLVVNSHIKQTTVGLFQGDQLIQTDRIKHPQELAELLKGKKVEQALLSGDGQNLVTVLTGISCRTLVPADYKRMATEETFPLLNSDRIANIFGALYHFPLNDCIIVDLGDVVRFDYVTKQGVYIGGAIFPEILTEGPSPILGKEQRQQEKSGHYFGLLGAIERIVAELRLSSETPSAVMSIATGEPSKIMQKDLEDFIDKVDPELTLIGLNQILKG